MTKRLAALRKRLKASGLDAIFVSKIENVFYFSGFSGEGALLISADGDNHLITDSRFTEQASGKLPGFKTAPVNGSWPEVLKKLVKKGQIKKLGFESKSISHLNFKKLAATLKKTKVVPDFDIIQGMRMFKDEGEICYLKKSVSIIKRAYSFVKKIVRPDVTEEALSAKIDSYLRCGGAEKSSFRTIVAANPRSSHPHASPSKKRLGSPSAVLVDMGCVYKGYFSDLTRMIFLGKIGAKFKAAYSIVNTAQEKAFKKIKPGAQFSAIDREARSYIAAKGFGKFFIHGLGHGIGLEIHESPTIAQKSKGVLKPGMVFTVEPGVYVPGWGGVRVEDIALVTATGCEVLTRDIPK